MPDPRELAALAAELARAAGAVLRRRPAELGIESKTSPTDAVTVMDRAAEDVVLQGLRARRPGDRIVAEESGDSAVDSEVTWHVDPLDGTVNYLYGLPSYAVSIAAVRNGVPIAGAVYDVTRDEMFAAGAGIGATLNGKSLQCTNQSDPALALVATGFGYDASFRAAQAGVLQTVLPKVRDIRRAGSAALDLAWSACGRFDAFYERGIKPWDWAAGGLIAERAGLVLRHLDADPEVPFGILAAPPALVDELSGLVLGP
jgi:fructose-1,6-bisphosphatase/inositol monophosphatase family enzyme